MNRAYAFAAGVVVAGVGVSLFAGNPNPPAGPIGPTMVSLDAISEKLDRQLALLTRPEWKATVTTNAVAQVIHVGPTLVHKVIADSMAGVGGVATIYDSADPSDRSTPIVTLSTYTIGGALNTQAELDVRVTKGVLVIGLSGGAVTVVHGN